MPEFHAAAFEFGQGGWSRLETALLLFSALNREQTRLLCSLRRVGSVAWAPLSAMGNDRRSPQDITSFRRVGPAGWARSLARIRASASEAGRLREPKAESSNLSGPATNTSLMSDSNFLSVVQEIEHDSYSGPIGRLRVGAGEACRRNPLWRPTD